MSSATSTAIQPRSDQQLKQPIGFSNHGVKLTSFEDAYRFSQCVVDSGWAPKGMDKPQSVLIALQHGAELGLPPMAALQNIAVINGKPGIYGDAALALVRASGLCEYHREEEIGTNGKDDWGYKITTKRKDGEEAVDSFTVADAKRAGLWGKAGPWTQYPKRMLRFRARGFSLRDNYGDVLKGLRTIEELTDMPRETERNVTPKRGLAEMLDAPSESEAQPTDTPKAVEYTNEQRVEFLDALENYILDAGVTEKSVRAEVEAAGVTLNADLSLTEQPTAVLDQVAKYLAAKAASGTVKQEVA